MVVKRATNQREKLPIYYLLHVFYINNFLLYSNRPFSSSPQPLCQNEVKCSAFDMEMIFHSHATKTHFNKKGCALGLILEVRGFGTRLKWPIKLNLE